MIVFIRVSVCIEYINCLAERLFPDREKQFHEE